MKTINQTFILAVILALGFTSNVLSAEIQLKSMASVTGTVVRLGDIAQIYTSNSKEKLQLAKTEITLAPSTGSPKLLHISEVKQTLRLRGVAIGKHKINGAANVKIVRSYSDIRKAQYTQVSPATIQAATSKISNAINLYLQRQAPRRGPWTITLDLKGHEAAQIIKLGRQFNISGGKSPFTGDQKFNVIAMTNRGRVNMPLNVEVSEAEGIVTTVRSLERGSILRASDVKIVQPKKGFRIAKPIHSIKDVIGKELTRSVSSNQPLNSNYLKVKILVKRGEGVTVYSYADGILIKTIARARESGGMNQTIEVESTTTRKRFFATVRAPQTVIVNASSKTVRLKKR